MKIYRFKMEKLVRNKSLERWIANGAQAETRTLSQTEFRQCLKDKVVEEAHEIATAPSPEELCKELADMCEVIDALCAAYNIKKEDVLTTQAAIRAERGGFDARLYASSIRTPEGNWITKHLQQQPEKYPLLAVEETE